MKRTVAKGTDNDQFELFLSVCQRHGLDPFVKQVYCVLFPVSKHHQDEKGIWISGHEMVIMTGIGGYRKMAARDHKDYAGSSAGKFTWFDPPRQTPAGRRIPESATVEVFRRGAPATVATVYWDEYAPADLKASRSDFWNRMPTNQLEKCAESKGLRKAFPGLGDVFTEEEMSQRLSDITAGGREIIDDRGFSPSGRPVTYEAQHGSHEAAQEAGQRTIEEKKRLLKQAQETPGTAAYAATHKEQAIDVLGQPAPPEAGNKATGGKLPDSAYNKDNIPPTKQAEPWKYNGIIELDYTEDQTMPYVRGDIAELAGHFPKDLVLRRKNDWFCCFAEDVERIKTVAIEKNFKIEEVHPRQSPAAQGESGKQTAPAGKRSSKAAAGTPAVPALVTGTIERITSGMTSRNNPTRQVKIGKVWYTSYVNTIFEFLDKGLGREAEVYLDARKNIVGLKRVHKTEFDADGRTPVVQRKDQEAGSKTLFGT